VAEDEHWLDIRDAVETARKLLVGSIDGAQAVICEACGSGTVRARNRAGPVPKSFWRDAVIDLASSAVASGVLLDHQIEISAADLHFWLRGRGAKYSLSSAPPNTIRDIMRQRYDNAERAGVKPPSVKEITAAVVDEVRRRGLYVIRRDVRSIAEEDEFKSRRGKPGRSLTKR